MAGNYTDSFAGDPYYILKGEQLSAAGMTAALNTKEKVANKQLYSTDAAATLTASSSSDSYYPTSKLVGKNLDALNAALSIMNTTINASLSGVTTSLNGKQDKISAGIAKNIVAYSGTAGTFDILTRAATIMETSTASASDEKIPTEKAVATVLAGKANTSDIPSISNLQEKLPVGTILMYDGADWADNSTLPGWYSCISTNAGIGCPDLVDRFIKGTDLATKRGTAGNAGNEVTIDANNLPTHTHSLSGEFTTTQTGAHTHGSNGWGGQSKNLESGDAYRDAMKSNVEGDLTTTSAGDHTHTITLSGDTGDNTTTAAKLNIEPQSYKLIYIRKCT
ncbi:MAG: hypothetical protein LBK68_07785 [Candidatus Margulisbacteria bacterium]|jgi:hypothetical protein|nr:hypothetical protein [Candidatus Margulisiibacteriota bacterium]